MSGEDLAIGREFVIREGELEESASRASGPGGQHVNKSNTRVTLRWNVPSSSAPSPHQRERILAALGRRLSHEGDLIVHADQTRSRARNRELARLRLAELVVSALAEPPERHPTRPTSSSRRRLRVAKTHRSNLKRRRGPVARDDD